MKNPSLPPPVDPDIEIERLPVKLTEPEIVEYGRECARAHDTIGSLETERKAANDRYKGEQGRLESRVGYLSSCINTGQEFREVECRWEFDYAEHVATLIRLDTNEPVRTRPIRTDEYQQELDLHLFKTGTEAETLEQ